MRVCVIEAGKLGACMAAVFASAGHDVVAADRDRSVVDALNTGTAPVQEPGLGDLLRSFPIVATTDTAAATRNAEVVFVVTPTPSAPDDRFDSSSVCAAAAAAAASWRNANRTDKPTLVVTSTVTPGSCRGEITAAIESTGSRVGVDVTLVYSPEFIALGSVIGDLRHPDDQCSGPGVLRGGGEGGVVSVGVFVGAGVFG